MASLESQKIPLKCPGCKKSLDPTVSDVLNRQKAECSSCKSGFVFKSSELNELRNAISESTQAQRVLEDAQKRHSAAETRFKRALDSAVQKATQEIKGK
jgi:hypothetical protein